MKAERPECREWRHSLGAYALGHLDADERAALEAHLDGCADCRAEVDSLGSLAHLLPLADPARFDRPAPKPAADLGDRIAATIGQERHVHRRQRQRRRFAFGFAAAAGSRRSTSPSPQRRRTSTSGQRWSRMPTAPKSTCT
jgi:anti-sigma factor RsiW